MRILTTLAAALTILGAADAAAAQARRGKTAPTELLESDDPAEVRRGIETIGLEGKRRHVRALAKRVRAGLPPELLDLAIDTFTVLGRPEAGDILFELASHRRTPVRTKAVEAIVACKPDGASDALVTALSDDAEPVRNAAALGLGEVGGDEALEPLFVALDRGVLQAATAIGQLADREHVDKLLAHLGRLPFDAMTPALLEVLARDDVPRQLKLDVIGRLAELATADVKTFLQDYVASLPPDDASSEPLRRAAEDAILRIAQ